MKAWIIWKLEWHPDIRDHKVAVGVVTRDHDEACDVISKMNREATGGATAKIPYWKTEVDVLRA